MQFGVGAMQFSIRYTCSVERADPNRTRLVPMELSR